MCETAAGGVTTSLRPWKKPAWNEFCGGRGLLGEEYVEAILERVGKGRPQMKLQERFLAIFAEQPLDWHLVIWVSPFSKSNKEGVKILKERT
jgi:hypothetical protein